MRWLGIAFGVVFTLNLLAAVPPTPADRRRCCPVDGSLGIVGSVAMLAITAACVVLVRGLSRDGLELGLPDEVEL